MRKFERVSGFEDVNLPERQTIGSAGYDFESSKDITIKPGETTLIPTGIKAAFPQTEVLKLYIRSSVAYKKNLTLANAVGIIDSDYYNNDDNEGHIQFLVHNFGENEITISKNERIGQGIFEPFLTVEGEDITKTRTGGFGSSNE